MVLQQYTMYRPMSADVVIPTYLVLNARRVGGKDFATLVVFWQRAATIAWSSCQGQHRRLLAQVMDNREGLVDETGDSLSPRIAITLALFVLTSSALVQLSGRISWPRLL